MACALYCTVAILTISSLKLYYELSMSALPSSCADEDTATTPVRQLLESVLAAIQQDALRGKALALI